MPAWSLVIAVVLLTSMWAYTRILLMRLDRLGRQIEPLAGAVSRIEILVSDREQLLGLEHNVDRVIREGTLVRDNLVVANDAIRGVAADLVVDRERVAGIADDLEQSHVRADEHASTEPGAAADAAAKSPTQEGQQ